MLPKATLARKPILGICAILVAALPGVGRGQESLFERDVLPVLTKQCLGCHGGLRQKGGLDMRTIPLMLEGGESGPAVVAKDPAKSGMWKRIANDDMPPGEKKLTAIEKNHIKQWIARGMPTVAERQKDDGPGLPAGRKHAPAEVAAAIDEHLDKGLKSLQIKAAAASDDVEFLRRVYLDLTGCTPTAKEAADFLDDKSPAKRAALIDKLLASPRFGEQFGRTWREWICPPELPSCGNGGAQPYTQARQFGAWMGKRFAAGDPWDKIVRDILTVEGPIAKNPQAIFFILVGEGGLATADGAARATGSLFLGVQLQCAQCHDDPYRSWAQREHWAMAAFFRRVKGGFGDVKEDLAPDPKGKATEIVIPKSAFKNAGSVVQASFLGGKTLELDKVQPLRPLLADWITAKDNPYFARSFVNRIWFYLFARGLVMPIDDFRELNPPTHPGLMKLLANEFADSDYDVKHLFRCLCNSQAYQRTSRCGPDVDDSARAAQALAFGRMPMRVMTADVFYDCLKQVYGDPKLDLRAVDSVNTAGQAATIGDHYLEFLRRFATNEEDATDFTHGIPQMLTLLNHPRLLTGSAALDAFRKTKPTNEQTVEWLYLSTLSRRPTEAERAEAERYLAKSDDKFIGILWMLVNRSEYLLVR